ncbi:glycosyltransferase family 4 protein [Sandarakinorhabdus sp. DWP1-3-1]|uniref:glycosyltransferase family 4 protein n=1 Tax=Sandarakinorhabdus sp. DWP1-3-1 TaxID=2804627 RepID=UPI003CF41AF5
MHIAFVIAALGAGGAERVIAQLGSAWGDSGHRVTVISFDSAVAPAYHDFGPHVRLLRLDVAGRGGRLWLRRVAALRATLRTERPAVAISFLTKINVVALLAATGLDIPVIVSERNNPRLQAASRWWTLLLDRLYPRADGIVIQTAASRECLPPTVADRAVVIANPVTPVAVDRGAAARVTPRMRILAAVGRLDRQKGFDLLLPAFAGVADRHPDWRLRIWGEGPERAALARQAASLGIADRVDFAGLSAPLAWIAEADAFVLSSRHEGWPNALAEALSAGLPVVAFDCRYGPRATIEPEVTGLLVADGDVAALGRAMSRLMSDAGLRAALGTAARASMAARDPGQVIAQWDALVSAVTRAAA